MREKPLFPKRWSERERAHYNNEEKKKYPPRYLCRSSSNRTLQTDIYTAISDHQPERYANYLSRFSLKIGRCDQYHVTHKKRFNVTEKGERLRFLCPGSRAGKRNQDCVFNVKRDEAFLPKNVVNPIQFFMKAQIVPYTSFMLFLTKWEYAQVAPYEICGFSCNLMCL